MKKIYLLLIPILTGCSTTQTSQPYNFEARKAQLQAMAKATEPKPTKSKVLQKIATKHDIPFEDLQKIDNAIKESDDYSTYREWFLVKTHNLCESKQLDLNAVKYWGGWIRSQRDKPHVRYFTYSKIDGVKNSDKIYITARYQK